MSTNHSHKGYSFSNLSHEILGACIDVQGQLGQHCMEIDYQRALGLALQKRGIPYDREVKIPIRFDGLIVTKRRVDFVVGEEEEEILLEIKARKSLQPEDFEQCLLYLRQGKYKICLLVNFGQKPLGIKRIAN